MTFHTMIKKILLLVFLFLTSLFTLTGCTQNTSLENLAYVIAIGIDKGDNNLIKLSVQFATPSSNSSDPSSEPSTSSESSITTAECASFESGINLINSYISKKINLSHCKVIVFSEEFAENGISNEITSLFNNTEIRPDCSIIVSRCDAYDFLNNSKPLLVNLIERYYEVVVNSGDYSGYSTNIKLIDFYSSINDSTIQPVAILGGINTPQTHYISEFSNYIDIDSSYKAGEALIKHKNTLEIMGLAVFNNDKLVGELNGIETISYLLLKGQLKDFILNISDPFNKEGIISLSIKQKELPKTKLKMVNNSPFISINVPIQASIVSLTNNNDYSSKENLELISKYTNSYIQTNLSKFLNKTTNNYNSDIIGYGRKALMQYKNLNLWNQSNWLSNYKNTIFKVNVNTTIKTSNLLINN